MVRKMATSGSELTSNVVDLSASEDETDLDSEFINPDSDCSEKPPVQKKRKTSILKKVPYANSSAVGRSLNIYSTSSSKGDAFAYYCLCSIKPLFCSTWRV